MASINGISVEKYSSGSTGNNCYWNIAANQLGEGATNAEIAALCQELQDYQAERNASIAEQGTLLYEGDEILLPLEYAMDEIDTAISDVTEQYNDKQADIAETQGNLATATTKVASCSAAYQQKLSACEDAAEDGSDDTQLLTNLNNAYDDWMAALEEQARYQTELEAEQQELSNLQIELDDYRTQLTELQTEYTDTEGDYTEELQALEDYIADLDENINNSETSLQEAQAELDAAAAQQEAVNDYVTVGEDGSYTLNDNVTADDLEETVTALEEAATVGSTKEVSSADISTDEDGNTVKTVTYADGTTAEYSQNENGEWELESGTIYDEDENNDEDADEETDDESQLSDYESALELAEMDGEIEISEEDGTVTYTNSDGVEYTGNIDDETGVVTFTTENEEDDTTETITIDMENSTKTTETEDEDGNKNVEFIKYTYGTDEDGNDITYSDTVTYETDKEGKLTSLTINETGIDEDDYLSEEFNIDDLIYDLTTLTGTDSSGNELSLSPQEIIDNAFDGYDIDASNSVLDSLDENNFDIDELKEAINEGNVLDYLAEHIDSENISEILEELLESDSGFSFTSAIDITAENGYAALEYICNAYTDALKDCEQGSDEYDTIIAALVNELSSSNSYDNNLFQIAVASEEGLSSEVIADVIIKYCGYPDESGEIDSELIGSKAGDLIGNALYENYKTALEAAFIELISSEDENYSDIAAEALQEYVTSYSGDCESIIDDLLENDDTGISFAAFASKFADDSDSVFSYVDKSYFDTIAEAYSNAYGSGDNDTKYSIAETLANDIYIAMAGIGVKSNRIEAIITAVQNNESASGMWKNIETAFNDAAADGEHKNFGKCYSTFYKYMCDQGGTTAEFAKEHKDWFDNTSDEVEH